MNNEVLARYAAARLEELLEYAQANPEGDCDDCPRYSCWDERHPWGAGTARERLCECTAAGPRDCPVVAAIVEAMDNTMKSLL